MRSSSPSRSGTSLRSSRRRSRPSRPGRGAATCSGTLPFPPRLPSALPPSSPFRRPVLPFPCNRLPRASSCAFGEATQPCIILTLSSSAPAASSSAAAASSRCASPFPLSLPPSSPRAPAHSSPLSCPAQPTLALPRPLSTSLALDPSSLSLDLVGHPSLILDSSNMDLINKLIIKGQKGTEDFAEMCALRSSSLLSPLWAPRLPPSFLVPAPSSPPFAPLRPAFLHSPNLCACADGLLALGPRSDPQMLASRFTPPTCVGLPRPSSRPALLKLTLTLLSLRAQWADKRVDMSKIKIPTYVSGSDFSSIHTMGSIRGFWEVQGPKWLRWSGRQVRSRTSSSHRRSPSSTSRSARPADARPLARRNGTTST